MIKSLLSILEAPVLIVIPGTLALCAAFGFEYSAVLSLIVVLGALIIFFAHFELSKPSLRQIMPMTVMGALAAAGRILFAAIPNFKPVTAICVVTGIVFGRHAGFMAGALAALISNFFLIHGPWTPWQMYAWGMTGYCAGVLAQVGAFGPYFKQTPSVTAGPEQKGRRLTGQLRVLIYGAAAAYLYGLLLNIWYVISFVQPFNWPSALIALTASLPLDTVHAVATVFFLSIILVPWQKKLERVKRKFDISEVSSTVTLTFNST